MKITAYWTVTSGTVTSRKTLVIGDDDAGALISGYNPVLDGIVQEVPRPRATAMVYYDRRNDRTEQVIRVSREHTSRDAALAFLLTLFEIPAQADIRIEHGATRKTMAGAILRPVRCVEFIGIRTVIEYNIRGGRPA